MHVCDPKTHSVIRRSSLSSSSSSSSTSLIDAPATSHQFRSAPPSAAAPLAPPALATSPPESPFDINRFAVSHPLSISSPLFHLESSSYSHCPSRATTLQSTRTLINPPAHPQPSSLGSPSLSANYLCPPGIRNSDIIPRGECNTFPSKYSRPFTGGNRHEISPGMAVADGQTIVADHQPVTPHTQY
jgi:hypothetical protein